MFLLFVGFNAQTSGSGEVSAIETKASLFESNLKKIAEKKALLPELEAKWRAKIEKVSNELAALAKERDNLIADMKVGARCSQCGKWKSEFEKEGVSFEKHLGDVKGYAVPATTPELEAIRKKYSEKIAILKVQLNRLEKGDDAVLANKKERDQLSEQNNSLCEQITQHSKNYDILVLKEAKQLHEKLSEKIAGNASDYLISNETVNILNNRVLKNQNEFKLQSENIKKFLTTENNDLIETKNTEIKNNEAKITELQAIKDTLSITKTFDIATIEAQIGKLKNSNQNISKENFDLTAGLSPKILKKIAETKTDFEKDSNIIKERLQKEKNNSLDAKKNFDEEIITSNKLNSSFLSLISEEQNRMLIAGKTNSCPIYKETLGKVATNWNQILPCLKNLILSDQIYASCATLDIKSYLGKYMSFLSGLDEEDLKNSKVRVID